MPLKKYHQKRNFKNTPEPRGTVKPEKPARLRFVVQKHAASHLHFDLRLECEGVMKSWAVPKGPTLDPHEKRLAMEVEDHPMEYNNFEGTIPEGNYGAGTVMIWDEGTYSPLIVHADENEEQAVKRHLKDGHLKFRLHGHKLHGEFAIVKIKNKFSSKNNSWLLIKHDDEAANKVIPQQDLSVRSGRTMDEITEGKKHKKVSWPKEEPISEPESPNIEIGKPEKAKLPENVEPMFASLSDEFINDKWSYELKWDGYRALAQIKGGKVRLYSRNDQDFNPDFPQIVSALEQLPGTLLLDGEVVAIDNKGVPRFQLLQNYKKGTPQKLIYYIFDILYFDKFDLRDLSLEKRQEILKQIIKPSKHIQLSEVFADGKSLFESAKKLGLEGIIAKKKSSKYASGRSKDWLKIKIANEREFVIGGYTKPKGSQKGFGSLLLAEYDKGELLFRGHVGTGFNSHNIQEIKALLDKSALKNPPFTNTDLIDSKTVAQWVSPKYVAQVKFTEWTDEHLLRHPVFLGLRTDKNAKEVQVEQKVTPPEAKELPDLEFTHLEKIYWPKDKYTKRDLLEYYNDVGELMLPYLVDRPQNLNRHPNGISGESFYHKDYTQDVPDYVKQEKIYSESNDRELDYILCQNKETLLFLANLGCIEINPWNSRVTSLEKPDYILFDLDPESTHFSNVVKVAQELHKLCENLEVPAFCKTSGKRGLHIYLPLAAKYNFEQVKLFAELVAVEIQSRLPKLVSLERKPEDRQGKVYIDYLQNRKGQTTACAYSVRPIAGARVSTPLKWSEVTARLDPTKFTIKTMRNRLDKEGDLWKGVLGEGIDIEKTVAKLSLPTKILP